MVTYPQLYQKSILFEIVNVKSPSEIVSAFTLTIPPESYEIVQSQRVTRTKTFGGMFIDDYGIDTAKITISGTTGNTDVRATYLPGRGGTLQRFNGKSAIYAFRDKIARYKNLLVGRGYESYEMRVYDLSTIPDANQLNDLQDTSTDGWVVSLGDFKMTRTKDRPLWYSYSIEMEGIAPLPSARKKSDVLIDPFPAPTGIETLEAVSAELNESLAPIKAALTKGALQDGLKSVRRMLNTLNSVYDWTSATIDDLFEPLTDLSDLVTEYIQAAGEVVGTGLGFYQKIFEVANFPKSAAQAVMKQVVDTVNAIEGEIELSPGVSERLGDEADYVMQVCEETKRIACQAVVFAKSQQVDSEVTVNVAGRDVTIYGANVVTVTGSTTLERLAADNYGDPSLALLIAMFNGISNDDIEVGSTIRVPLISRSSQSENNRIFSWDKQSNYGADVQLALSRGSRTSFRLVIAESGDFALTRGNDNLIQAINLRLNETLGKRLRLTVYGLSTAFGSARSNAAPVSYIITNLQDTLKQDPRIKSIDSIVLQGRGDQLAVAFNAQAIEDLVEYQGVI